MSNQRDPKHAQGAQEPAAGEHHEEHHLVEAPKGTSRTRFLLNLVLVVFLLLIFTVTGPMMSSLTGGNSTGETFMAWTMPDGERVQLDSVEFYTEKRRFGRLEPILPYLQFPQAEAGDDIETARFLILEKLAERAGVYVADDEISETILTLFGSSAAYLNYINNSRDLTPVAYESILRRGLIVRRYILLNGQTSREVLASDVVERWKENSKLFDFEYVEVLCEDYEDAARAALPDDAALEAYFEAMPPFQKARFNTEPRLSAELAWIDPAAEGDLGALLERYPAAEGEDPEEVAKQYFNSFSSVRFRRPEPDTEGLSEDEAAKLLEEFDRYYAYEDVADRARREAPVYHALAAWLEDLSARKAAGEAADLETEAIAFGLSFERFEPRTRTELVEGEEPWSGNYLLGAVVGLQPGDLGGRVVIEQDALVVPRLLEKLDPTLPPFAEIREQVADRWVEEERPKLAAAALEALRDGLGERPEEGEFTPVVSSEEFRAAAEAGGFEVQNRGWKRQFPRPGDETPTEAEFYLRSRSSLFSMEEGSVPEAEASRDGKAAYLVRTMGSQDPDESELTPQEWSSAQGQLESAAMTAYYADQIRNDDWLRTTFNLFLRSDESDG
jgi:integrase